MGGISQSEQIGIDITQTDDFPKHGLGDEVQIADDVIGYATYKYVKADAARSKGVPYTLRQSDLQLYETAVASNASLQHLAVPQADWAAPNYSGGYSYRYGWAAVQGPMLMSTLSNLAVSNCRIYLGATPGITRDTVGSVIPGLAAYSAITTVAAVGHLAKVVAANKLYMG